MATLLELRDQVKCTLSERVGSLECSADGALTFRPASIQVFALRRAPTGPELLEYRATDSDSWHFGRRSAFRDDEKGGVDVVMTHTRLDGTGTVARASED